MLALWSVERPIHQIIERRNRGVLRVNPKRRSFGRPGRIQCRDDLVRVRQALELAGVRVAQHEMGDAERAVDLRGDELVQTGLREGAECLARLRFRESVAAVTEPRCRPAPGRLASTLETN